MTPPRETSSGWVCPTRPEDEWRRPGMQVISESREESAYSSSGGLRRETPKGHALRFHALLLFRTSRLVIPDGRI